MEERFVDIFYLRTIELSVLALHVFSLVLVLTCKWLLPNFFDVFFLVVAFLNYVYRSYLTATRHSTLSRHADYHPRLHY
jgi:hypothetical protein